MCKLRSQKSKSVYNRTRAKPLREKQASQPAMGSGKKQAFNRSKLALILDSNCLQLQAYKRPIKGEWHESDRMTFKHNINDKIRQTRMSIVVACTVVHANANDNRQKKWHDQLGMAFSGLMWAQPYPSKNGTNDQGNKYPGYSTFDKDLTLIKELMNRQRNLTLSKTTWQTDNPQDSRTIRTIRTSTDATSNSDLEMWLNDKQNDIDSVMSSMSAILNIQRKCDYKACLQYVNKWNSNSIESHELEREKERKTIAEFRILFPHFFSDCQPAFHSIAKERK